MIVPRNLLERLARQRDVRVFRGYLAEPYDGIGQYMMITLTRGSTSAALPVHIASGDFATAARIPAGAPVVVVSKQGRLEVLSLGGARDLRFLEVAATIDT